MLDRRISFYIPSTQGGNDLTSVKEFNSRALEVATVFGGLFGGFTISDSNTGGWIGENGVLVTEKVKQVVAYTDLKGLTRHEKAVRILAKAKARQWRQEAISLEIVQVQGGLSFISG